MNLHNEFQPIRDWAREKGILDKGDLMTQTVKLMEESGELAQGVIDGNVEEVKDAIGDCVVVLTNLSALASKHFGVHISIEDCVNGVYGIISKRTGRMEGGTFIKDK